MPYLNWKYRIKYTYNVSIYDTVLWINLQRIRIIISWNIGGGGYSLCL